MGNIQTATSHRNPTLTAFQNTFRERLGRFASARVCRGNIAPLRTASGLAERLSCAQTESLLRAHLTIRINTSQAKRTINFSSFLNTTKSGSIYDKYMRNIFSSKPKHTPGHVDLRDAVIERKNIKDTCEASKAPSESEIIPVYSETSASTLCCHLARVTRSNAPEKSIPIFSPGFPCLTWKHLALYIYCLSPSKCSASLNRCGSLTELYLTHEDTFRLAARSKRRKIKKPSKMVLCNNDAEMLL